MDSSPEVRLGESGLPCTLAGTMAWPLRAGIVAVRGFALTHLVSVVRGRAIRMPDPGQTWRGKHD